MVCVMEKARRLEDWSCHDVTHRDSTRLEQTGAETSDNRTGYHR